MSNCNPAGRGGETEYDKAAPPEISGCKGVIGAPKVYTFGVEYDKPAGAMSLTVIEIVKLVLPPELVAVIRYEEVAKIAVGVPEITPVDGFIDSPAGSAGATE